MRVALYISFIPE